MTQLEERTWRLDEFHSLFLALNCKGQDDALVMLRALKLAKGPLDCPKQKCKPPTNRLA